MKCHEFERISFWLIVLKTLGFLNLEDQVIEISLDDCGRVSVSVFFFVPSEPIDYFLYRQPTCFLLPLVLKFFFKVLSVICLIKNMLERLCRGCSTLGMRCPKPISLSSLLTPADAADDSCPVLLRSRSVDQRLSPDSVAFLRAFSTALYERPRGGTLAILESARSSV